MNLEIEMEGEIGDWKSKAVPWQTKVYQGTAMVALVISNAIWLPARDFRGISESHAG